MKKIIILLLTLTLTLGLTAGALADYEYLDDMTLEEMLALQSELEGRISASKAAEGAADPTNLGVWQIRYYVDEFNNPTTEGYITTKLYVEGTFSNSATTNSNLKVIWLIDKDDVAIKLLEYGRNVVKSSYDSTSYAIAMLDADGNKTSMTGTMYKGSDRIYIDSAYESIVLNTLAKNGAVTFKITEEGKYASSSYLFKMDDTSYFSNAYQQLN